MPKRYSQKPFPAYVFVPGSNPHPKKTGGHMEGDSDPVSPQIDLKNPSQNETLRYANDLYNHGYFWESHVYYEALWNAHGRTDDVSDFLKGMIKLGAGGVKVSIGQMASAREHLERARELFQRVKEHKGPIFLGYDLNQIVTKIDRGLYSDQFVFEVHPNWE